MKEIKELEEKVWELIKEATKDRNPEKIHQLNIIAQDIGRIKRDIEKIQALIDRIERPHSGIKNGNSVSWEVTTGAIRQNLLTITKAKKAGLLPPLGQQFEVETSVGQVFQTDELENQNRLRERGKIREFYDKSGIRAGDKVTWTEIGPSRYYLEKSQEEIQVIASHY